MAANPLQPSEVETWFRQMDIEPTRWELDLLYRLDDAVLSKAAPAGEDKPDEQGPTAISTSDPAEMAYLMAKLEARQAAIHGKPSASAVPAEGTSSAPGGAAGSHGRGAGARIPELARSKG